MAISKIVFGGDTLIDLTDSTVSEDSLLDGFTAYGADGEKVVGGVKLATKLSELENDTRFVTGDIIKVSATEPDSEETKVWIKDSDNEEIEVLTPSDLIGYAKSADIIKVSAIEPTTEETRLWIKNSDNEEIEVLTPSDLIGYAKSADIYTKAEIDNKKYLTLDTLPKYDGGVK